MSKKQKMNVRKDYLNSAVSVSKTRFTDFIC